MVGGVDKSDGDVKSIVEKAGESIVDKAGESIVDKAGESIVDKAGESNDDGVDCNFVDERSVTEGHGNGRGFGQVETLGLGNDLGTWIINGSQHKHRSRT